MHFIKEIIQGDPDKEHVHTRFIRYGKGTFFGPIIKIKNNGKTLKISASNEYVNTLGYILAKNSVDEFDVSGKIISREDIRDQLSENNLDVKSHSKKKGVYTFIVEGSVSGDILAKTYSMFESAHIFLDLKQSNTKNKLKTKKKPPRPGSKIDEKFCSAVIDSSQIKEVLTEICFDSDSEDFKEINLSHTYLIKDIIIPEEYKGDYQNARIYSKRNGILLRVIDVDGNKKENEYELIA